MNILNFITIFLGCSVASSLAQIDIAAEITNFIATIGQRFKCGFSAAGIPVLEPLHIESTTFNVGYIGDLSSVSVALTNAYLSGLSQYTTENTKVNLFGGSVAFTTVFPQINLNGTHKTSGKTKNRDNYHHNQASSSFSGTGAFTVAVRNVRVESKATFTWFPTLKVSTNTRKVSIGSLVANFAGITPNGATINQAFSSGSPAWVNQNQDYINTQIQNILDQYITGIIVQQPNIMSLITAMISYDPLVGC